MFALLQIYKILVVNINNVNKVFFVKILIRRSDLRRNLIFVKDNFAGVLRSNHAIAKFVEIFYKFKLESWQRFSYHVNIPRILASNYVSC